ncbi:MAG: hypothetical protein ACOCUS_04510 [Polyangiales bacterium]
MAHPAVFQICASAALIAAMSLAWPARGRAQDAPVEESTYETTRGMAMGSGVRASGLGTSAISYNPAALALSKLYHLESAAGYDPKDGGWWIGGAAADSVTSTVAAGMSFRGVFNHEEANYDGYDGRLALAVPLADVLAIGVTGRFVKLRPEKQDGMAEPVADKGVKGFTMDASVGVQPVPGLHIAAIGHNLVDRDSALTPMLVGGSIAYSYENMFSIGGEGFADLSTFEDPEVIAGGGMEFFAGGVAPLRLGYRYDSGRGIHSVTGGIGYVDEEVGLDLSLRQAVDGASDTRLVAGFRYHVQ